jgi:hypothetical protein
MCQSSSIMMAVFGSDGTTLSIDAEAFAARARSLISVLTKLPALDNGPLAMMKRRTGRSGERTGE